MSPEVFHRTLYEYDALRGLEHLSRGVARHDLRDQVLTPRPGAEQKDLIAARHFFAL
jgi:hypothetical protein